MTAVNDQDIEKAFADQASGFVENKLGPLMKDEHRVGFEIVKKNDDNTRMVGIFAFKVRKTLLFAVVFFLNGEIKGPMLYRCDTKTFVPATKDWATYLIDSMDRSNGHGRATSHRADSPPRVNLQRIAFLPPSMGKHASFEDGWTTDTDKKHYTVTKAGEDGVYNVSMPAPTQENKEGSPDDCTFEVCSHCDGTTTLSLGNVHCELPEKSAAVLKDMESATLEVEGQKWNIGKEAMEAIKEACFAGDASDQWYANMKGQIGRESADNKGMLRELLTECDFGQLAGEAIIKAARQNPEFAAQVARLYGSPENLFPKAYTYTEKQAAADPTLSLVYDAEVLNAKKGDVPAEFFQDGFYVLDTRPEKSLSVVYEKTPSEVTSPNGAAVYNVLKADGTYEEDVLICRQYIGDFGADGAYTECGCGVVSSGNWNRDSDEVAYILFKDGKLAQKKDDLLTVYKAPATNYSGLHKTVEGKKVYFAILGDLAIGPLAIKKVHTVDGVQYCTAMYKRYMDRYIGDYVYHSPDRNITINPDLSKSDLPHAIFGNDVRFVELKVGGEAEDVRRYWDEDDSHPVHGLPLEHLTDLGGTNSVANFVFSQFGMPDVRITVEGDLEEKSAGYVLHSGDLRSRRMTKLAAMVKLAQDLEIPAQKSYELLKKASDEGEAKFFLSMNKEASRLHVVDSPDFTDDFDGDFGVPVAPTKEYKLRVQGDQMFETPSSIGDAYNPTTLTGLPDITIATSNPEDLPALADAYKLPHIFEHGVVGTLANTFSASAVVKKYVPKLEDGVDALGRIKFLLYWCPKDFEDKYGEDDMSNLEAEIDACYTSLGALLLQLLKKSEVLQRDEASEEKKDEA